MRILIIENVWMGKKKYGCFDKVFLTWFSILPTLYARQIAAITPKKHSVTLINERYTTINFNEPYDLVNINFTTSTASRAYEIADTFQRHGVPVVLSGLHASSVPNEAKAHADSVLLGRGELNWLALLQDVEKGVLKSFYEPVKYTVSSQIPPTNIKLPGFVFTGAIEATRGCPFLCEFCQDSNIPGGSEYYHRPIEDIINEIKNLPHKTFMFYDASLTIDPDYTKRLFTEMIGLKKKFFCNGNLNVLAQDEELVKLSKQAGCISWLIGFESVSQETLNMINKTTNKVTEYKKAVETIHRHRMAVIGCFIFGFDTDIETSFQFTMDFIKEVGIDIMDISILTPFPGTPLYNNLEKENRIHSRDWAEYNGKNVVFQLKNFSSLELKEKIQELYDEFYSIPYTIKRIIKSLSYGFYPFLLVVTRNVISNMNRRMFFFKNGGKNIDLSSKKTLK